MKTTQGAKIARRGLKVAASAVIGVAAYVHYLQLFILKITLPTIITGVVFGTIYLILSVGLVKSVRIFYLLGIIFPFAGAALAVIRLHLFGFEVFSVINIGFDIFVVPACAFLFIRYRKIRKLDDLPAEWETIRQRNIKCREGMGRMLKENVGIKPLLNISNKVNNLKKVQQRNFVNSCSVRAYITSSCLMNKKTENSLDGVF